MLAMHGVSWRCGRRCQSSMGETLIAPMSQVPKMRAYGLRVHVQQDGTELEEGRLIQGFGKDVRNHVGGRFVFEFDYVVFYLLACEMIFGIAQASSGEI